jgi:hypothetical protein
MENLYLFMNNLLMKQCIILKVKIMITFDQKSLCTLLINEMKYTN